MARSVVLVSILLLGLVPTARSQGTYRDVLERQMHAIEQAIAVSGYRPDPGALYPDVDVVFGGFESGNSVGFEVDLKSGRKYTIAGTDYDCRLSLQDSNGAVLFTGVPDSVYHYANILDRFMAPADGAHILVFDCPSGSRGFGYEVTSTSQTDSIYRPDPDAYPPDMVVGFLHSGMTLFLDVVLDLGVEYLIAGVCDQDCSDLDLALADEEGNILFTDELDDDAPVLEFTSPDSWIFGLRVTMYACSIEPCSFAYRVFRR